MYAYDNLRFFLIVLVVFGHMLELEYTGNHLFLEMKSTIYFWIYSFHMPAFVFLSGYFSRFNIQKILKYLVFYIVFQVLYILFSTYVLNNPLQIQFATPYWILWYIVVLIYYYCTIPIMDRWVANKNCIIFASALLSLASGYFKFIGYPLSLSRFLVFLPFFVLGYYIGQKKKEFTNWIMVNKLRLIVIGICGNMMTVGMFLSGTISASFFYGSYSYNGYWEVALRFIQLFVALSNIGMLLVVFHTMINQRIPYISYMGKATLSIYLLHGFFVKYLDCKPEPFMLYQIPIYVFMIIIITGNKYVSNIVNLLFIS